MMIVYRTVIFVWENRFRRAAIASIESWLHPIKLRVWSFVRLLSTSMLVRLARSPIITDAPLGASLQFGHLQGCHGIAVGQYGASGGGSLNHGWVADNVGRGALGEGFSFNLLTEQRYQILAGGTPSAKAPLR